MTTYFQREAIRPPFVPAPWNPIALEATRPWVGPPFLTWPEEVEEWDPIIVRQLLHEMMWALMEPGMHPPFALDVLEAWEKGQDGEGQDGEGQSGRPPIPDLVARLDIVLDAIEKNRKTRDGQDLAKLEEDSARYPLWAANFVRFLLRKEPEGGRGGAAGEGEDEDGEEEGEDGENEGESEEESEATKGGGGKGGEGTSGEEGSGEGEGEEEGESGDGGGGEGEGEEGEGGDEADGEPEEAEGSDEGDPSKNQDVEVEIHIVVESDTKVQGEQAGEVEKKEKEPEEPEEAEESDSDPAAAPEPLPGPGQDGRVRSKLAALLPDLRHFGTPDLDPSLTEIQLRQLVAKLENTPNVDKLLAMIGRLSSSAWMPAKRVPSAAREDVRDVTLGDDFSCMLPSELVRFAIPVLAPQAYLDLIEGRLNVLEFEGTEPRGRGPILLAVDVSPSMRYADRSTTMNLIPDPIRSGDFAGMTKLQVASMIALAMVRAASIQKRIVVVVGFAATVSWMKVAWHLPQYVALQNFLLDVDVAGMGTDFDPPLRALLGAAGKYKGGDLVFLTDGISKVSPVVAREVERARSREGLRLFSLLLGEGGGLEDLSDLTIPVKDLNALEHLGKEVTKVR